MQKLLQQMKNQSQHLGDTIRAAFRGTLNRIKPNDDIQKAQVSALAGETLQDVEFMQHFGFTSRPPAGSQAVIIPIGGKTSHSVVVASENGTYRIKTLASGEVAIYDESGSYIMLKKGRIIEVDCNEFKVTCQKYRVSASQSTDFTTPTLTTSAQLTAQGQISGNGGLAIQGGSGATFSGNVTQTGGSISTDGDVKAGTVSLANHTHKNSGSGKPQ
ncbi:phage baseplate assembly protein V [Pasteurellaceae bacterium HPA106]|uniref:phage baseplate assembly protein V n=1 Tax=Spirabiliibacterium pneumoniae TaxID=221400 RepID=UPI001AACAACE|nr:phage baseplate assembly protein V [Spirabiliibacterium pneumoniae]MBE2895450.1 phage baseplate assembly protein V [Spirabiliibacterium pneumoniae]